MVTSLPSFETAAANTFSDELRRIVLHFTSLSMCRVAATGAKQPSRATANN
jgi:hypothetical protein